MFKTYFSDNQIILLAAGICFFLLSLFFHLKEKSKLSIIFLLLSAFFIYCFAAVLDPFLNLWDERFHALVAKNMMDHPIRPTLYDDPVVNMAYDRWDRYHVWLHKQPLFLWQIALSFKLFGVSEFTLRLPSILLGVALVFIGYRSGKLLVNERTGYLTGVLLLSSLYNLELIAGRKELEHNDVAYLVYISLSIWSLIEYHYSKKKYWIYLIGLFAGCAILCKWLVGLLVYFGWFLLKLAERKFRPKEYADLLISVVIAVVVSMPWQIYIMLRFPVESRIAQNYNVQHIFEALDGHTGPWWYHFDRFGILFGKLAPYLILPAFIVLYKRMTDRSTFVPLTGMAIITYLFFSFVKTRMPSFPIITSLLIYVSLAALVDYGLNFINKIKVPEPVKKLVFSVIIIGMFFFRLDIEDIQAKHTLWKKDNTYTRMLSHNRGIFKSLELPENTVIFKVKGQHYIELMFYTGLPSYRFIPSYEQFQEVKQKGRKIAIFKPVEGELPDFIEEDEDVIVLEQQLQGYN